MGPRSIDRGIELRTAYHLAAIRLQWGRDQLIAELDLLDGDAEAIMGLQWGRDQLIAELTSATKTTTQILLLQWGRDQLIAELCLETLIQREESCFNGAAIN